MKDSVKLFVEEVKSLEADFDLLDNNKQEPDLLMKDRALSILSRLKRYQDVPGNEIYEDDLEDLIYKVIIIVGQL